MQPPPVPAPRAPPTAICLSLKQCCSMICPHSLHSNLKLKALWPLFQIRGSLCVAPVQQTNGLQVFNMSRGTFIPIFIPTEEPEPDKFHILLDHFQLPSALHTALSYCMHMIHTQPFTVALAALERQHGQPHQLALREIDYFKSPWR